MSHPTTVHIADLHFELRVWNNELKFIKDELGIFEHRLEELASKYTDKEVLAELEHFQNQFIRQNESADIMTKKVREADATLAHVSQENPVASNRMRMEDQVALREDMENYRNRYNGIKADFMRFLSKWM
jgi:hypothetical protein